MRVIDLEDPILNEKIQLLKDELSYYYDVIERFVYFLNKKPAKEIKELCDFQATQSKKGKEESDVISVYRSHINSIKRNLEFLQEYLRYDRFFLGGTVIECAQIKVIKKLFILNRTS